MSTEKSSGKLMSDRVTQTVRQRGPDAERRLKELGLIKQKAPPAGSPRVQGIFHLTDLGNAKRLIARHGQDLRYVKELGWLAWDGCRFKPDDTGEVERLAKATVAAIYEEASQTLDGQRQTLAKHALSSESNSRIKAMLQLAKTEAAVVARPRDFDRDPWLLNCPNGTLNLKTGKLREHRSTDLITKLTRTHYDPAAEAPLWKGFLHRITAGNKGLIGFLKRFSGYSATGDTREQCLPIFYGTGSNGKTTFLETIAAVLGDYASRTPASTFLAHRGDRIPNDIARLQGARFVIATETEQRRTLNEALIKQLTGSDGITARFLHREFFEFKPQFKAVLGTNHKPVIRGQDHAIWRRIRLVSFPVTIPEEERDKELLEKLEKELEGILAWVVRGCLEWQQTGLNEPEEVWAATAEYKNESDVLAEWMEDRCVVIPSAAAPVEELYQSYRQWCRDSGQKPLPKTWFGRLLGERDFDSAKLSGVRSWLGIGLRDPTRS